MPTIFDVAKLAHVSKSTVSRVLAGESFGVSESARIAVLEAVKELGYVKNSMASSMRTKKTNSVLLIIPDIANNFWAEVAKGAQAELDKAGYSLVLANSDWQKDRELRFIQMIKNRSVDAVIANTPELDFDKASEEVDCPFVVIGEREDNTKYPTVGSDSYAAIKTALEYFYSKNHKKIGFVTPLFYDQEGIRNSIRTKAYFDFLNEKKLEANPNMIIKLPLSIEGGQQLATWYKETEDKPTAILTGNDLVAVGFLRGAKTLGIRVPEDVSIIGIDDIPLVGMMTPAVTTLSKPKREIGATAASIIIKLLDNKSVANKTLLKATLIERDSVATLEALNG